jgi:hypothetical protein
MTGVNAPAAGCGRNQPVGLYTWRYGHGGELSDPGAARVTATAAARWVTADSLISARLTSDGNGFSCAGV